jgi:hypothetical protein
MIRLPADHILTGWRSSGLIRGRPLLLPRRRKTGSGSAVRREVRQSLSGDSQETAFDCQIVISGSPRSRPP